MSSATPHQSLNDSCLTAVRAQFGSDSPPDCHSPPNCRYATFRQGGHMQLTFSNINRNLSLNQKFGKYHSSFIWLIILSVIYWIKKNNRVLKTRLSILGEGILFADMKNHIYNLNITLACVFFVYFFWNDWILVILWKKTILSLLFCW